MEDPSSPFLVCAAEFSPAILCTPEVLGQQIPVEIGGQRGVLIFPSLPDVWESSSDSLRLPLKAPEGSEGITFGQNDGKWGRPESHPDGGASVSKALLKFIPYLGSPSECADAIYEAYAAWLDLFVKYIVLQTKQNTWKPITIENNAANLRIFCREHDRIKFTSYSEHVMITINGSSDGHFATVAQLQQAAVLASQLREPKLQYRLLLEAYRARTEQDWRKVVWDAASALECCLVESITDTLQKVESIDGIRLLKSYQGLTRLLELAKILHLEIPSTNLKKSVIDPRNSVAHKARFTSSDVAITALSECDSLIRNLTPQLWDMPEENEDR
jgi:hypothetical protein